MKKRSSTKEAIEIFAKLGVRDSVNCAPAISGMVSALSALDRHEEAMKHHEEAVRMYGNVGVQEPVISELKSETE